MKRYLIVAAALFVLLFSCKPKPAVVMRGFHDVPMEIQEQGAGCLFALEMKKYDRGEYMMATNADSIAFVVINDQMTRFVLSADESGETNTNLIQTYKSGEYTLRINMKRTGGVDEANDYKGEMTVEDKDGKIISKKLVGSCGA